MTSIVNKIKIHAAQELDDVTWVPTYKPLNSTCGRDCLKSAVEID